MEKNRWTIIGHLGKDAQTAITTAGKAVVNLSVAINEGYKDRDGVWQDHTTWVRVECWGRLYQYASKMQKGQHVQVIGRLKMEEYTRDEQKRLYVANVARSILLLASNNSTEIEGVSTDPEMDEAGDQETHPL